jgi:lysophospholipase L1-like esterase
MIRFFLRLGLVVLGCAVALTIVEVGFRARESYVGATTGVARDAGLNSLYILTESPQVYELRPGLRGYRGRIDINSLGLRGPEIPANRDADEFRVLFVGDSIAFGGEWKYEAGFPARAAHLLEQSGDDRFARMRSMNGGVPGYSPFNEFHWLREKGPQLHPDAVVIQFCLNDVVDPLPHWTLFLDDAIKPEMIPADAIPNPGAHRRLLRRKALERLRLFNFLESLASHEVTVQGRPAYLTEEQPISIEVYSNPDSSEIRWLRRTYVSLVQQATRLTPYVMILFVPLAYQLEPGYPVQTPQTVMQSIARENGVPLVDLTPALAAIGPMRAFRLGSPGSHDIWHLGEEGHDIAARQIASSLRALVEEDVGRGRR